jgi:hypothetical protein
MEPGGKAMSSGSAHEYEEFARDCVRLAGQADTPLLREKLLRPAREWMQAVMDEEDAASCIRARSNIGDLESRLGSAGRKRQTQA